MELHGADVAECSGEAQGVVLGSLKRGWVQAGVVASGDALWRIVVCLRGSEIILYL